MKIDTLKFRRICSLNPYKELKISLGRMTFYCDFINTERGDMYPVLYKTENINETVINNTYVLSNYSLQTEYVSRLLGRFIPFSEYKIDISDLKNGRVGIEIFDDRESVIKIYIENIENTYNVKLDCKNNHIFKKIIKFDYDSVSFSFQSAGIDIYGFKKNRPILIFSFEYDGKTICDFPFRYDASFFCEVDKDGLFKTDNVEWYLDNGVALADIKPVRYINGDVLYQNGKIFFTMSSRTYSGCYQSVFSWLPGTAELKLEGIILFDHGDGYVTGDVASSVLFDKDKNEFLILMCSFSHGHILGFGKTDADLLHGLNIIEINNMEKSESTSEEDFSARENDEDPDFYFDEQIGKWNLTICRTCKFPERNSYSYVRFISDKPFSDYKYLNRTNGFSETGGMFVKIKESRYFICGADFNSVSKYRIYNDGLNYLCDANFNYPDGGFRGWGTIINHKCGNKNILYWITFDRINHGKSNWSYGNLNIFEAFID